MDPSSKLLLDEIEKKLTAMDLKWDQRFVDFKRSRDERLVVLEQTCSDVEKWRSSVDAALNDVKLELRKMNKQWDQALLEHSGSDQGLLRRPDPHSDQSPPMLHPDGPVGHREDLHNREQGFGSVTTLIPGPVKGTHNIPPPPPITPRYHGSLLDQFGSRARPSESLGRSLGKLPKLPFPSFDGTNPRLWISRCENYFDMYDVEPTAWIRVASMYMTPQVACWFQAVELKNPHMSWPMLCRMLHDRFGRDQLQSLLRHLFRIHQTDSVTEYQERFVTLVDQLVVYQSVPDPLFFATRFVDGLCSDIRAVVMLQRPLDLDTACSLALLQEEVAPPVGRQDHRKLDFRSWSKQSAPNPLPLPPPPQATVPKSEPIPKHFDHSTAVDSKLGALKAYRRARGLCEKCAEKWHRGHTCSATVQLHVLQEVWDLLSDTPVSDAAGATNSTEESILMSLSPEAVSESSTKRSMQFIGHMCQQDILILVDSGSNGM
jgi:hypothetical protein